MELEDEIEQYMLHLAEEQDTSNAVQLEHSEPASFRNKECEVQTMTNPILCHDEGLMPIEERNLSGAALAGDPSVSQAHVVTPMQAPANLEPASITLALLGIKPTQGDQIQTIGNLN